MSHFYGTIQGNRGKVTRAGSKASGLVTVAASWSGAIRTTIWQNDAGVDCYTIEQIPWHGRGKHKVIRTGVLGEG